MKAIVLSAYGEAENLEVREVPDPAVGPDGVLVRVASASINPIDWKLRSGKYHAFMPIELPAILGKDASGTVVKVGTNVTAFKVGDRVLGRVNFAYADLVVGTKDDWALLPDGLDLVDAGALPLVLLTGAQLVEEAVNIQAGQVILVTGALGGVGRSAVYAAKGRGARVFAGVRGKQKVAAADLGADGVIALDDPTDIETLPALDAIADTVGGAILGKLLTKVKAGGTIGSVVGPSADAQALGLIVRPIFTHSDSKRLGQLAKAVADGKLAIPIAKRFSFAEAPAAHRFAEGGAGGKVLFVA